MSLRERVNEIRTGFERSFWVANFTEVFERVAYYGTSAVLAIYLSEQLHFSSELTGWLMGIFGFVVWFLPVLGGTLADRFGFRRALMFAYLIMTVGYFLLGSLSAPWMQGIRQALTDKWLVLIILMIPALGPSVVKPCVAGTTARASQDNVRALGYSIYYTLVNIGGTLGPVMAWLVRKQLGLGSENVFRVGALSVFLMFLVTLLFFREPRQLGEKPVASVAVAMKNMDTVLGDVRFVLFLVIFSSFFVVFWQEFISAPLFVRGYVDPNADVDLLLSVDALTVICFQILISYLTRRIRAFSAMTLGLLISSLGWLILAFHPSVVGFIAALVVVALGEITQVSRYYDYVSRLAPAGQEGLYMGYAFLPIAIGYFIAGPLGGYLLHYFGEVVHKPQQMWYAVAGVGVLGTVLMIIYDKALRPEESKMGRVGAAALARPGGGGDALPKRPKPRLIGVLAAIWLLAAIIQLAAPFMRGPRFVWVAVFFIVAWGTSKMYCWAWYANLIQCIGSFVIVSTGFSDRTGWYVVGLIAWAGLSALVATYLLLPVGRRAFGIRWSASSR